MSQRAGVTTCALTLALAAAGCGGGAPAAPSSAAAVPQTPASLTAGAYSLVLATSTGQSGFTTCISVGLSSEGLAQPPTAITVPAVIEPTSAGWTGRAVEGTLTFTLWQPAAGELAGTMAGIGRSESGSLSVSVGETDGASASLVGRQTSGINAGGDVVGRVAFQSASSSLSCNGNTWSLVRR